MGLDERKLFLCHASADSTFVIQVAAFLRRRFCDVYYYEDYERYGTGEFAAQYHTALARCNVFVGFIGQTLKDARYQQKELQTLAAKLANEPSLVTLMVKLPGFEEIPDSLVFLRTINSFDSPLRGDGGVSPYHSAAEICKRLGVRPPDDLPKSIFSYEKQLIDFFERVVERGSSLYELSDDGQEVAAREAMRKLMLEGCPPHWPEVVDLTTCSARAASSRNRLPERDIGNYRPRSALVSAVAREPKRNKFAFPEAGPRADLMHPGDATRALVVGIVVAGGIAPGINAVIDGIVQRHWKYVRAMHPATPWNWLEVRGYVNGFHAFTDAGRDEQRQLLADRKDHAFPPNYLVTADHAHEGGSMLGTYRDGRYLDRDNRSELIEDIVMHHLRGIDILYVIGGDGSMKLAHAIWSVANRLAPKLSVVGIPKTMDNDIMWVWQSFGFMSAVDKAREVVGHIHTEIESNPRLGIVQLFGSDSGFVVSHAVLASCTGHCDLALIPEVPFSLLNVARYLEQRISEQASRIPKALIVMAETAVPTDALWFISEAAERETLAAALNPVDLEIMVKVEPLLLEDDERMAIKNYVHDRSCNVRLEGQISDSLRRGGLKLMERGLKALLDNLPHGGQTDWAALRTLVNEPRHVLRSTPPSTSDVVMGHRLGILAVDNAMAGYTDFMISQWLTEFVLVPLELVVLGRKRIPPEGIFWKSVVAKTGQPGNLNI